MGVNKKAKVLFVCTGNSARSQMAEALLKRYAGDQFEVYSAGSEARGINPYTLQVLQEMDIDTAGLYSKSVKEFLGYMQFDYVITVCRRADPNCPTVYPETRSLQRWVFDDPVAFDGEADDKIAKFREVRDLIDSRVKLWLTETLE